MTAQSPFFHYAATFDPVATMEKYAASDITPDERYLINYLGVKTDPKFFPGILDGRGGEVEGLPIPANWHTDIAEWGAALRAIEFSSGKFRVAELGCGWGCWLNNTGVAARRAGLSVELIGVEGDKGHVQFAYEALEANGFSPDDYRIIHGIAAARPGTALFPNPNTSGKSWGLEPIFGASWLQIRRASKTGSHHVLPMITLTEIAGSEPLDLLHIDIQGGEADYVRDSVTDLNRLVRRLAIGTHSRQIEGDLMATLLNAGWKLEIERAAVIGIIDGAPRISVDGVQGWVNSRF